MLALAAICCLVATSRSGMAQAAENWPQRPIHIIVSFGAGGGANIIGRILADAMQGRLEKAVIVENKPGAGGILGNELVAKVAPDGYTLVCLNNSPAKCWVAAKPGLAKTILPGSALAAATSSLTLLAGKSGRVAISMLANETGAT